MLNCLFFPEPSDNPHKQKFVKSEQTSNSGSPYSTRPFIPNFISPIHLADADRRYIYIYILRVVYSNSVYGYIKRSFIFIV